MARSNKEDAKEDIEFPLRKSKECAEEYLNEDLKDVLEVI